MKLPKTLLTTLSVALTCGSVLAPSSLAENKEASKSYSTTEGSKSEQKNEAGEEVIITKDGLKLIKRREDGKDVYIIPADEENHRDSPDWVDNCIACGMG